jgi:hypothetical protein
MFVGFRNAMSESGVAENKLNRTIDDLMAVISVELLKRSSGALSV